MSAAMNSLAARLGGKGGEWQRKPTQVLSLLLRKRMYLAQGERGEGLKLYDLSGREGARRWRRRRRGVLDSTALAATAAAGAGAGQVQRSPSPSPNTVLPPDAKVFRWRPPPRYAATAPAEWSHPLLMLTRMLPRHSSLMVIATMSSILLQALFHLAQRNRPSCFPLTAAWQLAATVHSPPPPRRHQSRKSTKKCSGSPLPVHSQPNSLHPLRLRALLPPPLSQAPAQQGTRVNKSPPLLRKVGSLNLCKLK